MTDGLLYVSLGINKNINWFTLMAKLKCWNRTEHPNRTLEFVNKKRNLWVWVDKTWKGEYVVGKKNKNNEYLKTKSQALKSVNKYMKKHNKC